MDGSGLNPSITTEYTVEKAIPLLAIAEDLCFEFGHIEMKLHLVSDGILEFDNHRVWIKLIEDSVLLVCLNILVNVPPDAFKEEEVFLYVVKLLDWCRVDHLFYFNKL